MDRRPITIVTGGGRGIGAATAVHLARLGHDVAVNYRRDQEAADGVVKLVGAAGGRAMSVRGDLTSEEDVEQLFAVARSELGPVTGLVTTPAPRCTSAISPTHRSPCSATSST